MDAKQNNNRSPEILRGEMDADKGMAGAEMTNDR